ncbi:MAG: MlaD family protein [Marmoricola sp.]
MNKKLAFLAGALAIVLVAGFFAIRALTAPTERTFAADFADTTGVYVGNNVTYLGVPVGKVTKITAQGTTMRVQLKVTDPEDQAAQGRRRANPAVCPADRPSCGARPGVHRRTTA